MNSIKSTYNGKALKVLVGCEESQEVCKAFRALGHEAYSCDLQECSGGHPEWHLKIDLFDAFDKVKPDLFIVFPPCTDLSGAGAPSWKAKQADGRQQKAIDFVVRIYESDCPFIAIENPTGRLNTAWRKPCQIFHPFHFGEPYKKRTCLWLKGLPKLFHTKTVEPKFHYTSNSVRGGLLKDGTRKKAALPILKAWDNSKERSKTFPGIAKAMAWQWSEYILNQPK